MNLTIILVICAVVTVILALGGVAVKWILKEIGTEAANRQASADLVLKNQRTMKDDLKIVTDGHEKRIDRMEQRSADFMPKNEIVAAIEHEKSGRATLNDAMMRFYERNANDIVAVRVEVGKLQAEHTNLASIVGEIKSLLKEQRHETNERLDQIAKDQRANFDQLCCSIREIRKTPEAR